MAMSFPIVGPRLPMASATPPIWASGGGPSTRWSALGQVASVMAVASLASNDREVASIAATKAGADARAKPPECPGFRDA